MPAMQNPSPRSPTFANSCCGIDKETPNEPPKPSPLKSVALAIEHDMQITSKPASDILRWLMLASSACTDEQVRVWGCLPKD
jgi:hypothetical protein